MPGLAARLPLGPGPLLFYAGAFAARPRSADRLAAILFDWLGQTVEVGQFASAWLDLGRDQMTSMPAAGRAGQFHRLGVDAAVGARFWDIQSRIMLHIGALQLDRFEAMVSGRPLLTRLAALARAYLDGEVGFAINPVLAAHAVPKPALGASASCQLGWNSWLPTSGPRHEDATEAMFRSGVAGAGSDAETLEARA